MSLEPPGAKVFTFGIRSSRVPSKYRSPTYITKYGGETDPGLWLQDYCLMCLMGGAESDAFIIRNLPLDLANSARSWLEHLLADKIACWEDRREIFVGNFRARTNALATRGTSRTAGRSQGSPSGSTYGTSPRSAMLSQRRRCRRHRGVPFRNHLQVLGAQTRPQGS